MGRQCRAADHGTSGSAETHRSGPTLNRQILVTLNPVLNTCGYSSWKDASKSCPQGEEGQVLLRVRVTAEGRAEQVNLHRSSGFERLDERAVHTVRQWKFMPARQGGKPVDAWVIVPIQFSLKG